MKTEAVLPKISLCMTSGVRRDSEREVLDVHNIFLLLRSDTAMLLYSFCLFFFFKCSSFLFSVVSLSLLQSDTAVSLAADLRLESARLVSHILPGAGGIMPGIPPDIPVFGPNRICLCCCSCCCSSCSLSVSNTTGSTRIMKEVVPTQSAEREKL